MAFFDIFCFGCRLLKSEELSSNRLQTRHGGKRQLRQISAIVISCWRYMRNSDLEASTNWRWVFITW